jgi:hypothetical protein
MLFLAAIIYFSVYLEHWSYKRLEQQKDDKARKQSLIFIKNDLEQRQRFIEESLQFKDYKPFFTDMWDAIVLAERHSLLPFDLFRSLQRTYAWMKYYNNEIELSNKSTKIDEKVLQELLQDVKKQIEESLIMLKPEIKSE